MSPPQPCQPSIQPPVLDKSSSLSVIHSNKVTSTSKAHQSQPSPCITLAYIQPSHPISTGPARTCLPCSATQESVVPEQDAPLRACLPRPRSQERCGIYIHIHRPSVTPNAEPRCKCSEKAKRPRVHAAAVLWTRGHGLLGRYWSRAGHAMPSLAAFSVTHRASYSCPSSSSSSPRLRALSPSLTQSPSSPLRSTADPIPISPAASTAPHSSAATSPVPRTRPKTNPGGHVPAHQDPSWRPAAPSSCPRNPTTQSRPRPPHPRTRIGSAQAAKSQRAHQKQP